MDKVATVSETRLGIPFCINCVGWHPDQLPTIIDAWRRMKDPQKDAFGQHKLFEEKRLSLYRNKSCALCGRSYDDNGELDTTWKITAKRVKQEFDNAGVFGVADKQIEIVVARCRKAVEFLIKHRMYLFAVCRKLELQGDPDAYEKMTRYTFAGTLAFIITHAQEARKSKVTGSNPANIKGTVR